MESGFVEMMPEIGSTIYFSKLYLLSFYFVRTAICGFYVSTGLSYSHLMYARLMIQL